MRHRDDPEMHGVPECALQRGDKRRSRRVALVGRLRESEGERLEQPIVMSTFNRRKATDGGVTKPDRTLTGEELECNDARAKMSAARDTGSPSIRSGAA